MHEGGHSGNSFAGISLLLLEGEETENRIWTVLTHHFQRVFAPRCPCDRFKRILAAELRLRAEQIKTCLGSGQNVGKTGRIDHCTVSVAILDVGQSRQKLQQMYGILFNFQR